MSSQKYYSSPRQGSLLPSCITPPGTNQSSKQECSDLQMYQRWKRKIPFQQPEGTWLQISELLRKIEHSGGLRGCIPAGIPASPQLSAGREELGAMPILQSTDRTGAGMALLSYGLQHRFQALVMWYHSPHTALLPLQVLCPLCTPCSQHTVSWL